MDAKTTKKKTAAKAKKEPNSSALLKKVASVSDSNKALQKEIKVMSKIFGENQKVLISMKGMIDTLTSTLEYIQKQSKQIDIIEGDTQKLYAGLNQVRSQSNLVNKINDQTSKLEKEISRISELQKLSKPEQVEDSINSAKNNSQMIIKIAQRIDEVRDDLRKVSGKSDSFLKIGSEMDDLKNTIKEISGKTAKFDTGSQIIESLKQELGRISDGVASTTDLHAELDAIKITIDAISSKASKIDSLGGVIDGLKQQFDAISSKANAVNNLSIESIKDLGGKIDKIETEIGVLVQRADSTAFVGEGLKSAQKEFSNFKENVLDKTNSIEQKISSVSDTLKRQDESTIEFHKKSERLFQELQSVKEVTSKASGNSSKEVMALLKLSEYQSNIRMNAESKYGVVKDIEKMASQTADIVNLFDRISIESGEKIPLPHEVRQWAVGKILDCADKWEVRFSDVYSILTNTIGRDMLKESIRIQQVRDIYGIRAVDEIRIDLNIS
ncbi:MAG: chemotaxis protein [Nitrosopumilus sp.]|nr:chemotaxis protein [Nitrosopumilus sp.]MDF2423382.1 chemotaxis protein [Nitrosopumilus sp.]MDF2425538.1 chemotaxis protein [Nitrosopumilus sp.]MDF2426758.1 chemotaxis protein [Nitrosopumilus sp.]MDF2427995.1 chemotaxis protein [Nitrosopumilus sp.]